MKNLLTLMVALFTAMTLFTIDAEAKRFGGGKSFGKQYNSFSKPKSAQQNSTANPAGQNSAMGAQGRQSGMGRWLGPLAGLAAGGLLASLFFGDAFEGLQIMDMLLVAGLIFGGIMLFKAMRGKAPRTVGATPAGGAPNPFGQQSNNMNFESSEPAMGSAGLADDVPAWFTPDGFVDGAKTHFIRLQAAWDKGDFRDIREYTTPEMFAELQQQHQSEVSADNYTEVMMLNAEYLGGRREGDQLVVSVRFTGMLREAKDAAGTDLDEIWNVVHDWDSADGDWLIAGIQQDG